MNEKSIFINDFARKKLRLYFFLKTFLLLGLLHKIQVSERPQWIGIGFANQYFN
jgi:hypothetical protein